MAGVRPRLWLVGLLVAVAAVHGAQVAELGLYWDDILQYLQGHHSARGDLLRFVASDTSGSLSTERPLSFLVWAAARLVYAWCVPALHALLVVATMVEAVLMARLALRLHGEAWAALTAGALFASLPLAPLQSAWAATVHYHGALILALLAMLGAERAVARARHRLAVFAPAALAFLASLLVHEVFLPLPIAWLVGLAVWPAPAASPDRARAVRRSALRGLGALAGAAALWLVWRELVLPRYGTQVYAPPTSLEPLTIARRALDSLQLFVWPWSEVGAGLRAAEIPARVLVAAALAAVVVGVAVYVVSAGSGLLPPPANRRARPARAIGIAALLVLAAVALRAMVPVKAVTIDGLLSRFNFVALPGVALSAVVPQRSGPNASRLLRVVLAAVAAVAVGTGALFHGAVKERLVVDWRRLHAVLEGILAQAPALADGSFVVVAGDGFGRIASHEEMSSLFMALYDNETLMANDLRRLRVERAELVSVSFGQRARWFLPRDFPVVAVDATVPVGAIAHDRLVLFRSRGNEVTTVPVLSIRRASGPFELRHCAACVLPGPARPSPAWTHLETIR